MLAIDVTRLVQHLRSHKRFTGVDRVSYAYLQQYHRQAVAMIRVKHRFLFLSQQHSEELFRVILNCTAISPARYRTFVAQAMLDTHVFARHKGYVYLLHTAHSGLEHVLFKQQMRKYHLKGIYFLHDLIPIDYPEYCREGEKEKHIARIKTMAETGVLIIANSQYTQQRLLDVCQHMSISLPKHIVHAHLACDSFTIFDAIKWHVQKPYFVVLGTIEARKNHQLLLDVWRQLVSILGAQTPELIIIGKRGWECDAVFEVLDHDETLRPYIRELSNVNDHDLQQWVKSAQAMLFPSFVEGFGLPLVEAIRLQVPVVASQNDIFKEISQGLIPLHDVHDVAAWADEILHIMRDTSYREQLIARALQIKPLTWKEHFNIVHPHVMQCLKPSLAAV